VVEPAAAERGADSTPSFDELGMFGSRPLILKRTECEAS